MTKKILMVSPFPSHPPNAGSNARILQIASGLKQMGHEVHFLLSRQSDDCDDLEMKRFWGGFYYDIRPKYKYAWRNLPRRVVEKIRDLFKLKLYFLDQWYYDIDDWYDQTLDPFLTELTNRVDFDVVIVEYVFLSRALKHFGDSVLKIIDTHDIFVNRHREIPEFANGEAYKWFTATARDETRGLNRADIVLAIQSQEETFFKQRTDSEVVTVGHLTTPVKPVIQAGNNYELLFIGTKTQDNWQGIEFFIKDVFPKVQARYPQAKLLLAGKICELVTDFPGCIKLGVADDLRTVYQRATVVINPALSGTGLAIKSIEALSHAKPLVAMPRGARGLESGRDQALLIAQNAEEYANYIIRLFEDDPYRQALSQHALEFSERYYKDNRERLSGVIDKQH